jgi:hypothetical protein
LLISLLLWWAHAADAGGWAGSAVCRSCHEAQYWQQVATPHARALARAADARYEWAFGAPVQATTYVSKYDEDHYVEHRLSYYTATGRLAPTPGHEHQPEPGVLYRLFSPGAEILRCFQCHSTGPLRVTGERRIEPFEAGVRCEVCHGAGAAHARAPAKSNILNPKRYSAAEVNQFCGACHRKPAPSGESTDFRDPWNARHQPLYFAESACYQKSGGRLSCLTCHPPHGGAVKESCGNCHNGRHKANVAVGGKSCVACHMPPVKPRPELSFANHWIGVYRAGETLTPRRR